MENVPVTVNQDKREIGEAITKDLILSYMNSFGIAAKLNDAEKTQFINVAIAYRLNPFKREIYCNPYNTKDGRKLSIITGYEVYLKRAERIGDLDGWKVTTTGAIKDHTLKAQITIHRKSWKQPFEHEVSFDEYNLNQSVWLTKPITMLKKVVTAQGFRLAFPDELGGMPYTADELPGEMTGTIEVKAETVHPQRTGPVSAQPTKEELEAKAAQAKARLNKGKDPTEAPKDAPAKPLTPPASPKPAQEGPNTAIGFITSMSEPNKGGYTKTFVEGYKDGEGKDIGFSTADQTIIDTLLKHMDNGEKVSFTYEVTQSGRWLNYNIVEMLAVTAEVGE